MRGLQARPFLVELGCDEASIGAGGVVAVAGLALQVFGQLGDRMDRPFRVDRDREAELREGRDRREILDRVEG